MRFLVVFFVITLAGIGQTVYHIPTTGQSLSRGDYSRCGETGYPACSVSTNGNYMMTGFPPTGSLTNLQEPATTGNGQDGEAPATSLGNQASALGGRRFMVNKYGVDGAIYSTIKQGTTPYNNLITGVTNGKTQVLAIPGTYWVPSVVITHGESDWPMAPATYEADLVQWQSTLQTDINAAIGQTGLIPIVVDQMNAWTTCKNTGSGDSTQIGQWHAAMDHYADGTIFLSTPKYTMDYSPNNPCHLSAGGSKNLGEYQGRALDWIARQHKGWKPTSPRAITLTGAAVTLRLWLPVGPVVIDTTNVTNPSGDVNCPSGAGCSPWGFHFTDTTGTKVTVTNVTVASADTLTITLASTPMCSPNQCQLQYAYYGADITKVGPTGGPRGNIRDSDVTVGWNGDTLSNWLITFNEPVGFTWEPAEPTNLATIPGDATGTPLAPAVLTDVSGSTQTNRPNMIFRTFKQGDIAQYAQAVVNGVPVPTQCDVKTRWPDNSVKQAMVSFVSTIVASGSITVTFQNQSTGNNTGYLSKTDLLARSWDAEIQTVASSVTKTADARTILNAASSISTDPNSLGVRYWLQGPVVTQVILEDRTSARSNDFGYTCSGNCTVNLASTAVNTTDGTITSNGHTLQAGALVTLRVNNTYCSPPSGFTNSQTYYVVNPAANTFQLSVSNGGAAIVPSTQGSANLPFCPLEIGGFPNGTATWASDTTLKSLHPVFVLTFFAGYTGGVKVDYVLTDDWTTALQDQRYAITIFGDSGNGTTKYSHAAFPHYAMTRWRKTYWSGTALGDVKFDHGFAYLESTGLIPNYDTTGTVTAASIAADASTWTGNMFGGVVTDQCDPATSQVVTQTVTGGFPKDMGTTGQTTTDPIGIIPAWQVRWLYGMSNPSVDNTSFNGPVTQTLNCSGLVPIHLWESATGRWFDAPTNTINAFGHPVSVIARPTMRFNVTTGSDDVTYAAPRSTSHGWVYDAAHQPSYGYFEYLMTGDWYPLQEMLAWNSYNQIPINPDRSINGRAGAWGYLGAVGLQARGNAWTLRSAIQAAISTPDGTAEKSYFTGIVNNFIQISEGRYNITTGAYPPSDPTCAGYNASTTTDKWCWGNQTTATEPEQAAPHVSPLGWPTGGTADQCAAPWTVNYDGTTTCGKLWMMGFLYAAWGHGKDQGFSFESLLSYSAKAWINLVLNPNSNPYMIDSDTLAEHQAGVPLTGWGTTAGVLHYAPLNTRNYFIWNNSGLVAHTPGPADYANIFKGMASWAYAYSDGSYTGGNMMTWLNANVPNTGGSSNPKWDILPRGLSGTPPTITTTSPLTSGTVGIPYSAQFQAMGDTPITWTYDAVPGGLTFTSGGLLSGTPTTAGTSTINVTATNGAGSAGPTGFSITIGAAGVFSRATGMMTGYMQ